MRRMRSGPVLAAAGAGLLLAGCGGATDELAEGLQQLEEAADQQAAQAQADDGDDEDRPEVEPAEIEFGEVSGTVRYGQFEYTLQGAEAVDLDVDEDGQVGERRLGAELTFEIQVLNTGDGTGMPGAPMSVRWEVPDTGDAVTVSAQPDFREVPADATTTGEVTATLPPSDLEVWDGASARLVIGHDGRSPAQLPLGADAELVDRFPVPQPFEGTTLEADGVTVTITAAELRWDNPDGSHVDDGEVVLELRYDMVGGDSQSCSTRGSGAWALTLPSGDSIVDLGVSERCVRGGETETDVLTGFALDVDDSEGSVTLTHERGDEQDQAELELVHGDGLPAAERDTR